MNFKDMAENDRNVFIDFDFFGEVHLVEGQEITIVIDDDNLQKRKGSQEINITEATILFYAKSEELPVKLFAGKTINFDGKECLIDDVTENMGISAVAIHQNRI